MCSGPGICSALSGHLNCLETDGSVYALHQDWHFYGAWRQSFKILLFEKLSWCLARAVPGSVTKVVCSWGRNRSPLQEELGSVLSAAQEIWAPWLHLFNRNKCSQMGMCVKAWTSLFGLSLIHRPAAASACSSCYHFWVIDIIAEGCCSFSFELSLFLPPPSHDLTFKNS